jgi:DeoR/GlpR family transcriptional regulator of sugar metabolism
MTAHAIQPRRGKNLSNAAKIALRAEAVARIRELLGKARLSVVDLARVLRINSNTVYGYLRYMAEMGEVRRSGEFDADRREKWELGAEDPEKLHATAKRPIGAVIVPAQQVGMSRHWMDVALFGPAQGAAA